MSDCKLGRIYSQVIDSLINWFIVNWTWKTNFNGICVEIRWNVEIVYSRNTFKNVVCKKLACFVPIPFALNVASPLMGKRGDFRCNLSQTLFASIIYSLLALCSPHWNRGRIYVSLIWVITIQGIGLSPVICQAIPWTNDDLLSSEPLETSFRELLIEIKIFSLRKMYLKMSSA